MKTYKNNNIIILILYYTENFLAKVNTQHLI